MARTIAWLVLGVCCGSGCTHLALEHATIRQASTTSDLQYQQVLDNLAMFAANPDALAWHMKLSTASIQVTDQGTLNGLDTVSRAKPPSTVTLTSSLTAQRGIVNQWAGIPTIDPDNLELLDLAYQKAIDPVDPSDRINRALFEKIRDLSLHFNIVLGKDTLDGVIKHSQKNEAEQWQLQRKNDDLHKRFDTVLDQIAKLSLPPTDVQVDDYAMKLYSKVTEETRGQAREKLQAQQQQQKAQVSLARLGVEDQIVKLTRDVGDIVLISRYSAQGASLHNPHDIAQAELQIKVLWELATAAKYQAPWVATARCCKKIPHGACYVGHSCKCGGQSHVWVPPEHWGTLRDFTLAVLALAPISSQESPQSGQPGTLTYSPTVSGGGH